MHLASHRGAARRFYAGPRAGDDLAHPQLKPRSLVPCYIGVLGLGSEGAKRGRGQQEHGQHERSEAGEAVHGACDGAESRTKPFNGID